MTRLTWQASQRDKIRFYLDRQFNGEDYNGFNTLPTTTPEASTDACGLGWVPQVKWTQTTTNKLLLEAGLSYYTQDYEQSCRATVGPRDLPRLEQTTNRLSVAVRQHHSAVHQLDEDVQRQRLGQLHHRFARLKTGMTMQWGTNSRTFSSNAQINTLVFNNGLLGAAGQRDQPGAVHGLPCPLAVVVDQRTGEAEQKVKSDLGFFVQDTWTINRLTLNLGARFDHFNAEVPAAVFGRAMAGHYTVGSAPAPRTSPRSRTCRTGTTGRCVSPAPTTVRQRQDRDQGERQQVHRRGGRGLRPELQPDDYCAAAAARRAPGSTSTATSRSSMRPATSSSTRSSAARRTSAQITNRPDPDLQRGYNWEYSALGPARVDAARVGHAPATTAATSTTSTSPTT